MKFTGQIRVPEVDHPGVPATFLIENAQAEVILEGESLGRWSLFDVHARRLVSNAFQIDFDGEELTFLADEPMDFAYRGVEHMAEAWARFKAMNLARRTIAVARSRRGTKESRIGELLEAMESNLEEQGSVLTGEPVAPRQTLAERIEALAPTLTEDEPEPELEVSGPSKTASTVGDDSQRQEIERLEAERRAIEEERLRLAEERERLEADRAEAARRDAERVEAFRIEMQRLEAERAEHQKKEAELHAAHQAEMDRLRAQREELERLQAERRSRDQRDAKKAEEARQQSDRLEAERLEAARAEGARAEAAREEAARQEMQRLEEKRRELELAHKEREKAQRQEAQRLEAQKAELERLERERRQRESQEVEGLEALRAEAERLHAQREEAERLQAQQAEAEREAERRQKEEDARRQEEERRQAERRQRAQERQAQGEPDEESGRQPRDEPKHEQEEELVGELLGTSGEEDGADSAKQLVVDLGRYEEGEGEEAAEEVTHRRSKTEPEPALAAASSERSGIMGAVKAAFTKGGRNHVHDFTEAPGGIGIARYICRECGYVSISVND